MGNKNEVNAAYAYDNNGIRWTFSYNSSTLEITKLYTTSLTEAQAENLVIPATIRYSNKDYTVKSIGSGYSNASYAFPKTIKNLTIPDTVTEICNYAFSGNTGIENVIGGSGITTIGTSAFVNCTNLESITLPAGLLSIGNSAFSSCKKLTNITLPEGLTTIGSYAFGYCEGLTGTMVFPKSVTNVSGNPIGQTNITTAKVGDNFPISVIREMYNTQKFQGIEIYDDSEAYKLEDGTLFSKDGTRLYLCAKKDYNNYVVPSTVTSIEANAFQFATSMTGTLTLNEGLLSIGNNAFSNKGSLTGHLRIPDSVITIGTGAFRYDKNFDRVTVGSGVTRIESYTFSGLEDLFINNVLGSVEFANYFCDTTPVVHFLNSTKHVLVSKAPGVKLVNVENGNEVDTGNYIDETTFKYRVEVEDGYSYDHLEVIWFDDNKYEDFHHEAVVAGQEYEFTPLLRNRNIYVHSINENIDLSLRTFITEVNRTVVSKSRIPIVNDEGSFEYLHTKEPVRVKKGDLVTYKIRVYNEALTVARATEITVHIPDGITFDEENTTNKNNGWIKDGDVIKTSQLALDDINSYFGNGVVNYKDVEICLTVTEDSLESEVYKTVFAEITGMSGADSDSTPGNVNVSQNYRIDEITNSNTTSFIFDQEDDDDFDTVVLNSKIRVEYNLRIEKIDKDTDELLAGAKFELLSSGINELVENGEIKRYEDEEVIARVTSDENGIVDFGGITTYGEGENIFWIKEIDAPSGYLTNIGKKMKVKVVKTILDEESGIYSVSVYCESSDYMVDTSHYDFTPVSTAEQLAKMGSGEIVNVDGIDYQYNIDTNYRLTNDIDLAGINWTPIDKSLVGIIDGDGHKISNLTIVTEEESSIAKIGLIGEFTGIIENLTLENPNIHITTLAEVTKDTTDYYGVGGFVGYMKNGYFYNCKTTVTEGATSSITASIDNIGGFVGHTAPNGLVTIINSENNVDVIGAEEISEEGVTALPGTNNVGGLIGCSLGSISIQNSKNTGKISCGKYGAGGLVGFVRPSDYEELAITAGYDEDNKRIDLLVENQAAEGQYNVTLEIRDRKTDRLIGGAIYEVDKVEDVIKTALVDTGSLKLFDKAIEYTGRDVYFMTEEETVPGYDLLNGIIRVDIDRYWDVESNGYKVRAEASIITHKEYEEFIGERSTKEDDTKTGKTFERGDIFTEANVARANWNGSKIEIVGCTNEGKISASYSNSGGMIGTAYGVVTADKCTNNGEIIGQRKSAGIVAELKAVNDNGYGDPTKKPILPQQSLDYSVITNCTNNGKISGLVGTDWTRAASGGLVGEIFGFAKVINGTNNGEIYAEVEQVGGIVGKTYGAIIIEDSANNGKITLDGRGSTTSVLGGILGQAWVDEYGIDAISYSQVNSKISNCINKGELYSYIGYNIGGIVGAAIGNSTTITNCETVGESNENKLKLYATVKGELGGILAWSSCKHVTIKDCKVKYVDIEIPDDQITEGTICNVAGIFAVNDAGYIPARDSNNKAKRESTKISNCIVEDCIIINKSKEVAGIMGITNGSYGYIDDNYVADIYDCKVKNTLVAERGDNTYYPIVAGIYAGGYNLKGYNIKCCNVEDSRLELRGETEDSYSKNTSTVGGIFGRAQELGIANIEDCNVTNTTLYNRAQKTTAGNTGGIFGTTYGIKKDVCIKNCNVKNCNIIEHNANAGGIMGGIMQDLSNNSTVTIEKCNVIETDIIRLGEEIESVTSNDGCVGGIAGSIQDITKVVIKDVNVIGKDIDKDAENANERNVISSKFGNVGGAIGMTRNNIINISNILVKNYDVINDVSIHKDSIGHTQLGGFVGALYGKNGSNSEKASYKDITVDNVNVKGNKTQNTAGFVAWLYSDDGTLVENVNVKNTNISSKLEFGENEGELPSKYGYVAGLVATNQSPKEFVNCNVTDCVISSRGNGAAGGVAYEHEGFKAKDCNITNVEIRDDWTEPESIDDVVAAMTRHRNYGGFMAVGASGYSVELDNIQVKNVDINAKYASIGGIYGYAKTIKKLENCTVEDCEFTSTKSISGIDGACAGIGANTVSMNGEARNNKVKNVQITTDNHINAGMFGFIKNGNPITINDSTVENVTLTHENKSLLYNIDHKEGNETALIEHDPVVSGLVGVTESNITINNAIVKNSTITGEKGTSNRGITVAGILAMSDCDINIDGSKVINTVITNNTPYGVTSGFVGLNVRSTVNNTKLDTDMMVTITNSSIEQNSSVVGNNIVAGLVGYAKVNLDNDKVLNTTLKGTSASAGVIGVAKSTTNTINRITVKDLTMPDGENLPYNNAGIAGVYYGTISNSTVTNATIYGNGSAAGVVAIMNPNELATSSINNVTVTGSTIVGKSNHAAGIVGVDFAANITYAKVKDSTITSNTNTASGIAGIIFATIDHAEVDNTTITSGTDMAGGVSASPKSAITNVTIKDTNVLGQRCVGGVAGVASGTIDQVEIDNVEVTSDSSSVANSCAGGVAGVALNTISNVEAKDLTITSKDLAGGVAGFASGINTATIDNANVNADNCAGGVVGCTPSPITNVNVKDSTITGKRMAGGVAATVGEQVSKATVEGTTVIAKELHAGGIAAAAKDANIDECSTKNSTIKTLVGSYVMDGTTSPTCLGGLVGVGLREKPTITNSTVENNTLIGATGSIAGKYIGAPTEINDILVNAE